MLLSYVDQLQAVARRRRVSLTQACILQGITAKTLEMWKRGSASPTHELAKQVMDSLYASGSDEDFLDIIAALRDARMSAGISQLELDDRAGFTDGHIAKFESGQRTPHSYSLFIWALSLGLSLSLLPRQGEGCGTGSFPRPSYKGVDLDERIKTQS